MPGVANPPFLRVARPPARAADSWLRVVRLCLIMGLAPGIALAVNSPPTIQGISNQTVLIDHPTSAQQLALAELETLVPDLRLSGESSDETVVPNGNIFFGLALGHWYTTVTPTFGVTGSATITLHVSDGEATATTNFLMTVNPPPPRTTRFTNLAPITIPESGAASPYPSVINVTGMSGPVSSLSLTLNKFSHENVRDVNMLLVGPAGQGAILFSHVSGDRAATNVTVYLTDTSGYALPIDFPLWSEPLRPADFFGSAVFPGAPPGPYGPTAFATFYGQPANGPWSLYIYDDGPTNTGSIAGGWSLLVGTLRSVSLSPIADQSTVSGAALTAIPFTVDNPDGSIAAVQVTTESSNPVLLPPENMVLDGSGTNRALSLYPVTGEAGTAVVRLKASDGLTSASTSFFLTVTQADARTRTYVNRTPIVIPSVGIGDPYPSTITVDGVPGRLTEVIVIIKKMQHTYPADVDMLLVGPQGQQVVIFSDAGRGDFRIVDTTVVLSDLATDPLPEFGPIVSGTFRPTNYEPGETGELDSFPGAPDGPIQPELAAFNGLSPNGTWSLYVVDDGPGDQGEVSGGWSLLLTVQPAPGEVALRSLVRLEDGSTRIQGDGDPSRSYSIQGSSDLKAWETLGLVTPDAHGDFDFQDTSASSQSSRFYRITVSGTSR